MVRTGSDIVVLIVVIGEGNVSPVSWIFAQVRSVRQYQWNPTLAHGTRKDGHPNSIYRLSYEPKQKQPQSQGRRTGVSALHGITA